MMKKRHKPKSQRIHPRNRSCWSYKEPCPFSKISQCFGSTKWVSLRFVTLNICLNSNYWLISKMNRFSFFQALCSGLKYALTNLLDDFQPMLPDLCNLIVAILQSKCVAPAIDIAKSVIDCNLNKIHAYSIRTLKMCSAFPFSAYFYITKRRHVHRLCVSCWFKWFYTIFN